MGTDATQSCVLCGGATSIHWRQAGIVRCDACQLLSLERFPSAYELNQLYSASWREPERHRTETGATSRKLAASYVACLKRSLGVDHLRGMRILEFGAGSGEMMVALAAAGAEVIGVEPFGLAHLQNRGLKAYADLKDVPGELRFHGVVALDVIEHLEEPRRLAESLRLRLLPGGWTLWATPNAASLNARLSRSDWREIKTPGHLIFFKPESMEVLLEKSGYRGYQRLQWDIQYGGGLAGELKDRLLRSLRLDGELRYLAYTK